MTQTPSLPLIRRALNAYWQVTFGDLTIDHPVRMAAVFSLLANELGAEGAQELSSEIEQAMQPVFPAAKSGNPCDPERESRRQEFIDWLYDCSGRREAGNYTYTGLYEEFLKAEAARLNQEPCH